jgi:hypothetical protein
MRSLLPARRSHTEAVLPGSSMQQHQYSLLWQMLGTHDCSGKALFCALAYLVNYKHTMRKYVGSTLRKMRRSAPFLLIDLKGLLAFNWPVSL